MRPNKYIRNKNYKKKLESKVGSNKTYWSHVMFYTDQPDPKDIRKSISVIYRRMARYNITFDEAVDRYIDREKDIGNGKFIYFDRPEVPYSIIKVHTSPSYSRRRKYLTTRANRIIRRRWKQYGEYYNNNTYKKAVEVALDLD